MDDRLDEHEPKEPAPRPARMHAHNKQEWYVKLPKPSLTMIAARVLPEVADALRAIAEQTGVTKAQILREALTDYLAHVGALVRAAEGEDTRTEAERKSDQVRGWQRTIMCRRRARLKAAAAGAKGEGKKRPPCRGGRDCNGNEVVEGL